MTTPNIVSVYPDNSTNANFQAWGGALSAAILAAGWSKSADTGQINFASVTAPSGVNQVQGYEIWTMATGGLTTYYLKLEYGSAASTTYPAIWLTMGTGTNGSGTLTGQLSTRFQIKVNYSSATTMQSCCFAGAADWFACCLFFDYSQYQYPILFAIERIRDSSGANTDNGVSIHAACYSNQFYSQVLPPSGAIWTLNSTTDTPGWAMQLPPDGTQTTLSGSTTGICLVHPFKQYHLNPVIGLIGYYSYTPDISAYSTFTVSRYGTNHTYFSLGNTLNIGENISPAIRYE